MKRSGHSFRRGGVDHQKAGLLRTHVLLLMLIVGGGHWAWAAGPTEAAAGEDGAFAVADSVPRSSIVFVEGYDDFGRRLSLGAGVIVKKGFVAVNYHYVAGMKAVSVFKPGDTKEYKSDGYLSVEESKDLVIISAPGLTGNAVRLNPLSFPEEGTTLQLIDAPESRQFKLFDAKVAGSKEIMEISLPQMISNKSEDCTGGPIFRGNTVVGFCTAGYLDDRYYAYAIPASELRRLMNRSFIIKSYNSLSDSEPIGTSYYQKSLMESLTSVLWLGLDDAERLARKKGKMMLINVYTTWAGWSKLMKKNTYSSKRIIRYINENFYAVRLDAEAVETLTLNNLAYDRKDDSDYHALAYSLLEGKMEFPSTVFLDEEINVLLVVPGYMDPTKMEVVLHYFSEKAYLNTSMSFGEFERKYFQRANRY